MQSSMLRHITEDFGNGGTIDGTLVVTGDLQVDGGGTLSFNEIIEGTSVIDVDSTTALVVRKNNASGDVLIVDTDNSRVGIGVSSPSYSLEINSSDEILAEFAGANASYSAIKINNTATGGDDYYLMSTADSNSLGGGVFSIYNSDTTTHILKLSSDGSATFAGDIFISNSTPLLRLDDSDVSTNVSLDGSGGIAKLASHTGQSVRFLIGSTEVSRFDSSGNLGIGVSPNADTPLHIFTNSSNYQTIFFDNAGTGRMDFLMRSNRNTEGSASHSIMFDGGDDGGVNTRYAKIENYIVDNTNGTEDGKLVFSTMVAGTSTETLSITGNDATFANRVNVLSWIQGNGNNALFSSPSQGTLLQAPPTTEKIFFRNLNGVVGMTYDAGNQRVGIGTESPSDLLHLSASIPIIRLTDSDTGDYHRIYASNGSLQFDCDKGVSGGTASSTIGFGIDDTQRLVLDVNSRISLSNNDSGGTGGSDSTSGNTLMGYLAGNNIASGGVDNTFYGHEAGAENTTGDYNTAVGSLSNQYNETGNRSTYVGYASGLGVSGNSNSSNVGVGYFTLKDITTGGANTVIGAFAGDVVTTQDSLTLVGKDAGGSINHNDANGTTAIGAESLALLTNGRRNTAVGYKSLESTQNGDRNTAVGYQALGNVTGGNDGDNTGIGYNAGHDGTNDLTSGTGNTLIGSSTRVSSATGVNQTVIGYNATGLGNNSVTLGNSSVTDVFMASDGEARIHCSQIQFPSSQIASSHANRLDDYEEGTWSPVYTSASGSFGTMTMDVTSATYTKVGRKVTCNATFKTDNVVVDTASGVLFISGLPFTVESNGDSAVTIGHAVSWASDEFPISGFAREGETRISLLKRADANDRTQSVLVGGLTTGASADSNLLIMSVTYFV